MLIGAHVKMNDPVESATATGADLVQIFLSDPQSWKKPEPRADADALRSWDVPVYVHSPYLVNLASGNNKIRIPSRKILQQCCDAAADVNASAVIVHGGHVDAGEDEAVGFERWVKGLEQLETTVPVYLENTAGGDHAMARKFDTLARLWEHIAGFGIGFCLDTCHAHAAGESVVDAVERILAITGRIDLVHCNDSKDAEGSGRDRHENLGKGTIAAEVLAEVVRRADAPVVCETPADGQAEDIAFLKDATAP
ncbi:MAG TPA: deoxyribonuclease IV [Acidimicrobiales bacterium]|nr:deoxyribonuclease IV [Acidimicrobiales bacterium]